MASFATRHRLRRFGGIALVLAIGMALPGAIALASHQFTDVPDSNQFHADISAIADAGVTTGCAPNLYCPKDFVTREQMAAFMNRLGALQAGKTPVVNADKVDGIDSTGLGHLARHSGSLGAFGYQLMAQGDGTSYYAGCVQMQLVGATVSDTSEIWKPDGTTYGPSYAVAPVFGPGNFVYTAVTTGTSGKAVVYQGIIHTAMDNSCTYTIVGTY